MIWSGIFVPKVMQAKDNNKHFRNLRNERCSIHAVGCSQNMAPECRQLQHLRQYRFSQYFDIRLPPQWCSPSIIFSRDTWKLKMYKKSLQGNLRDEKTMLVKTFQGCLFGALSWPPTILVPWSELCKSGLPQWHTWSIWPHSQHLETCCVWPLDQSLQSESHLMFLCTHMFRHNHYHV